MSSTVALNKTRSPPTGTIAGEPSFNSRPVLLRRSSSAKSGFRSLCGQEQRSFYSYRAIRPAFWNLSTGVALALENRFSTRFMPGSCTGVVVGT
jgi:hypothetical protein